MATLITKGIESKLKKQIVLRDSKIKTYRLKLRNKEKQLQRKIRSLLLIQLKHKELLSSYNELSASHQELSKYHPPISSLDLSYCRNYSYPIWVIQLCILVQVVVGVSHRQVCLILSIIFKLLGFELAIPAHTTVRDWVHKFGKNELDKDLLEDKSQVAIIDESIGIGQEQCFLALGIDAQKWSSAPKSLTHADVSVCALGTSKGWNSESIKDLLWDKKEQYRYVVSDNCRTLGKAIRLCGLIHVPDCTHFIGNWIKNKCQNNELFKALIGEMAKKRTQWCYTNYSGMLPPRMRAKSKFLNIYEIAHWLEKVLVHMDKMDTPHKEALDFVSTNQCFAYTIVHLATITRRIFKLLKTQGINELTTTEIYEIFATYQEEKQQTIPILKEMEAAIIEYVQKIRNSLPMEKNILCCSDIIESVFGRYKYRNEKNSYKGITQDILVCAIFGKKITPENVKDAINKVTCMSLTKWVKENLVPHYTQNKRNFWMALVENKP